MCITTIKDLRLDTYEEKGFIKPTILEAGEGHLVAWPYSEGQAPK